MAFLGMVASLGWGFRFLMGEQSCPILADSAGRGDAIDGTFDGIKPSNCDKPLKKLDSWRTPFPPATHPISCSHLLPIRSLPTDPIDKGLCLSTRHSSTKTNQDHTWNHKQNGDSNPARECFFSKHEATEKQGEQWRAGNDWADNDQTA